jgi:hypothetical protein
MNFALLKDVEPEDGKGGATGASGAAAAAGASENRATAPSEVPSDSGAENYDGSGEAGGENVDDGSEGDFVSDESRKPLNRNAIMLVMILAIGAGGTWFMYQRTGGPSAAKAAAADPAAAAAEAAVTDFMKGGRNNITLLRKLLDGTAKIIDQFRDYTNVMQVPLSDLKSNPFHFALAKAAAEQDPEEIAKKKREEQRAAVLKAAQGLQLQSVVIRGNRKACMVSNSMYQEGEAVNGFLVEKISPNSVVVSRDGFRFELKMANGK